MPYVSYQVVSFGSSKSGLGTVGYQLYNSDGSASGGRITAGIQDLGAGQYGAAVTVPDAFQGRITWDTGETIPAYASGEVNPPPSTSITPSEIADGILIRSLAGGADDIGPEARNVQNALRAGRNRVAFDVPVAGQFTVFAEDDVTPAWTGMYARETSPKYPLKDLNPA